MTIQTYKEFTDINLLEAKSEKLEPKLQKILDKVMKGEGTSVIITAIQDNDEKGLRKVFKKYTKDKAEIDKLIEITFGK